MAAQFFGGNLAGPTEMTEMLSTGLDTAEKARIHAQKRKYEKVFQDNLDAKGKLNEKGFYQSGVAAGLNPDQLREAARYHVEQTKQSTETAQNQSTQRMMGYEPNLEGRNQAGYGTPEPLPSATVGAGPGPVNENTIDADKLRSPSAVGTTGIPEIPATLKTGEASAAAPGAPASSAKPTTIAELKQYFADKRDALQGLQAAAGATPDGQVGPQTVAAVNAAPDLLEEFRRRFEGRGADTAPVEPTATAQPDGSIDGQMEVNAPAPSGWKQPEQPDYLGMADQGTAPVVPEDNRSWLQRFEDSYNPALSPAGRMAAIQKSAASPDPSLFEWKVTDSGNEFQKHSQAQMQYLDSLGAKDAPAWLESVWRHEFEANAPKMPNPYAMWAPGGGIDQRAQGEAVITYEQQMRQAQGKAAQAVQAEKRRLLDMADKHGTQTNTSKRFDADMAGRLKGEIKGSGGIVRNYNVSEAEKARGDIMAQGFQDVVAGYKAGKQIGGGLSDKFATDYGAATAAARANGTLNEDAIVANLVSMGAVPSASAVVLKQALAGQGGNLAAPGEDVVRWVRGEGYKGANAEQKRELWYKNTLENIKQGMATVGYSVDGKTPIAEPAAPAPAPAAKPAATLSKNVSMAQFKKVASEEQKAKAAKKGDKPVKATKADPLGLGI